MQEDFFNLFDYKNPSGSFILNHRMRTGFFEQMTSHIHQSWYEIYYLVSGERYYIIQDHVYAIQAGDLVIINKKDRHHTADRRTPGHERLLINFREEIVGSSSQLADDLLLPFVKGSGVLRLNREQQIMVETLLAKMIDESKRKDPGFELYAETLLKELLLLIYRWSLSQMMPEDNSSQEIPDLTITQIARYITMNYREDITLERLSQRFFISPFYLSRMFKKLTGTGLVEYLQLVRMREAQRLLKETDEKVISIAEQVGYTSVAHFNRLFKKSTLCTPRQFRKKMQTPAQ